MGLAAWCRKQGENFISISFGDFAVRAPVAAEPLPQNHPPVPAPRGFAPPRLDHRAPLAPEALVLNHPPEPAPHGAAPPREDRCPPVLAFEVE